VDDILQMACAAGSGLARPKNAENSRKNEGSSLKPGVSLGAGKICSSQSPLKISVAEAGVVVAFFILNFPFFESRFGDYPDEV
jgi:hypothetical protein